MTPTPKSPAIDALLTELTGISRQEAMQKRICTCCKKPILGFRDALSEKEYRISGMCQHCQDQVFTDED